MFIDGRVGEIKYNKHGTKMMIVEYNSSTDIIVEFQDEYKHKVKTQYSNFKRGSIKNPYDRIIYDVGYIGVGKYKLNNRKMYNTWHGMLERCYNPYIMNKFPTYKDCIVESYFHNLQNFGDWYDENYYEIKNETMCLDKDILFKGNKIYERNKCIFVPQRINKLFTKSNKTRGDLPIGVSIDSTGCYIATCYTQQNNQPKTQYLGRFNNPIEAFNAYKNFKEKYIKYVADLYVNRVPDKLIEALYHYEVDIND